MHLPYILRASGWRRLRELGQLEGGELDYRHRSEDGLLEVEVAPGLTELAGPVAADGAAAFVPFIHIEVDPVAEWIGTFDPQLCEEFWRAFAFAAGITLHIRSLSGVNGHHVIEASFKGVARALRDAVRVEGAGIPSTKGTL